MKKLLITTAVLACAAIVTAQTVTSQNIVGYTKVNATPGALSLVAVNFDTGGATVQDLIGDQLPVNSTLNVWDKSQDKYINANYTFFGWNPNPVLDLGDSFWFNVPGAGSPIEVIIAGEVLTAETNVVALASLEATGYYYPVETLFVDTDLSTQLPVNSQFIVWNGTAYDTYNNTFFGWQASGTAPAVGAVVIGPAQGFWVNPASAVSWEEERPFTP